MTDLRRLHKDLVIVCGFCTAEEAFTCSPGAPLPVGWKWTPADAYHGAVSMLPTCWNCRKKRGEW